MENRMKEIPDPVDTSWETDTLSYYNTRSASFVEHTLSADMSTTRNRFTALLPANAYILDLGCGSGRDAKAFLDAGYRVDAIDGSEELCKYARAYTGIDVRCMRFQELDMKETYDGIWACASLLHLPEKELEEVLRKVGTALKMGGILYTSFKYGDFSGMRDGRFFTDFTEDSLREFLRKFPEFSIEERWITSDVRPGREEEKWINILLLRN